jgi:hypothetical protein
MKTSNKILIAYFIFFIGCFLTLFIFAKLYA